MAGGASFRVLLLYHDGPCLGRQLHVDRGDGAACGGDDPCWKRIRGEVGLGDRQRDCRLTDAAHLICARSRCRCGRVAIVSSENRTAGQTASPADNRRRVGHGLQPGKWRACRPEEL